MKSLLSKLKEAALSVAPIAMTVFVLGFIVKGFTGALMLQFFIGALMLVIGMALFNAGADAAMLTGGNLIGADLTKSKKLWLIIIISLVLGVMITVAEPTLMVLAGQLSDAINSYALIFAVGIGVGVFLLLAVLRILFKIPLKIVMFIAYGIIFTMAFFVPKEFLPLSFDSGGVATGPMTVPFIMAFGAGIAATNSGSAMDDSFGLVGLCAMGPIIAVMSLGLFADPEALASVQYSLPEAAEGYLIPFVQGLPRYMLEVSIALLPLVAFVMIYNFVRLKLSRKSITRIGIGFVNVYAGLVIFLTGVNVGFAPVGRLLGAGVVTDGFAWALIPIGVVLGLFVVLAEPAVHVLTAQVEEISGGTIKKKKVTVALMLGVAVSLGLTMFRVVTGINILWIVIPGYTVALILTFFSPKVFTAISIDSGGVASGPITATFILPFAIGASLAKGGNVLQDAFGAVALVTMTPLIAIQLLGVISTAKARKSIFIQTDTVPQKVIDFDNQEPVLLSSDADIDSIVDFDMPNTPAEGDGGTPKRIKSNLENVIKKVKSQKGEGGAR